MKPYIPKNLAPGISVYKDRYVVVRMKHGRERFFKHIGAVSEPNIFVEAEAVRNQKIEEWRTNRLNIEPKIELLGIEKAREIYWENHVKDLAQNQNYKRQLDLICDAWAMRTVDAITSRDVKDHVKFLKARGLSKSTINRHLACISGLFTKLDEWQALDEIPELRNVKLPRRNPCKHVERESEKDLVRKIVLTPEQFDLFMMGATIRLRRAMLGAVHSILRKGDLSALTKSANIDAANNIFTGLQRKSGRKFEPPITPQMWDLIRTAPGDQIFDFTNHDKEFKAARRRAGMPEVQFRDLRRTGARMMLRSGVDIATVQKYLGHGDLNTTQRYVGASGEDLQAAGKILDGMYKWPTMTEAPPCSNCGRQRGPETLDNAERLCTFCAGGFKAAIVRRVKNEKKSAVILTVKEFDRKVPNISKSVDIQVDPSSLGGAKWRVAQETLNLLV